MHIKEVCKELSLPEDYPERIFNSNSRGELFHVSDYKTMLDVCNTEREKEILGSFIIQAVEFAEAEWSRPESVFQHMPKMVQDIALMHARKAGATG